VRKGKSKSGERHKVSMIDKSKIEERHSAPCGQSEERLLF